MPFKDTREYLVLLDKEGQLKHIDVPFNGRRGTDELRIVLSNALRCTCATECRQSGILDRTHCRLAAPMPSAAWRPRERMGHEPTLPAAGAPGSSR